jgi:D-inositol-3-phosphate glycosyltransferase
MIIFEYNYSMRYKRKIKIAALMVHTSPLDQAGMGDAGGMNVYVFETAKQLAQSGVAVDIFTRANHPNLPDSADIAEGVSVKYLVAGPFEGLFKEELPSQLGALTSAFMNHQKKLPKDFYSLIHSHYWISGQLGWVVSEATGMPLIHTMHTTAKVKNLNLAEGEKPEPHTRAIGEEQVVKASAGLIANTDAEAASLVSLYNACPDNVFVVAPGVDLGSFSPADGKAAARVRLNIAPDAYVLIFVGRIQPHKGPDILLRAAAEMVTHSPHFRAKLAVVIVGGTSRGVNELEKLKLLAQFLKIADITHFVNPVSREVLPDWYRASDLVCIPSHSESFGLVALEAQACGTPVVATAIGGLRTAVSDGISGSLIDGHNSKAWSAVISKLLMDPQRRLLLSRGAIEHASRFGWENTASKTLDVYDLVLSRNTKSNQLHIL